MLLLVESKAVAVKSEDISVNKGIVTEGLRSQIDNRLIQALYNFADAKDWRMKANCYESRITILSLNCRYLD